MRLTVEQLASLKEDGVQIGGIDTAFLSDQPERVGVAVSGGGDSMALLHFAWRWSVLTGVPIEAVTVNHGLRPEAADEAAMVAAFCANLEIKHTTLYWDGPAAKGNLAAAGRDARYSLIGEWAMARGIGGVLLGHTQDDIAETFLMRLARKSGVDGLAMMTTMFECNGVMWGRPLVLSARHKLRDYLRRHNIEWVDDPTNENDAYERSKARKVIAALAPLGISADGLASVAADMLLTRLTLRSYTVQEGRRVCHAEQGDVVLTHPKDGFRVPLEIERRLIISALQFVGGAAYAPRASAIANLRLGFCGETIQTLAGCLVTNAEGTIRIAREYNAVQGAVDWPNRNLAKGWDGRWLVSEDDGQSTRGDLVIRALGERLSDVPDWREVGLPRASLMATPAVFDGDTLISAPIAGLQNGFSARIVADFGSFLLSR